MTFHGFRYVEITGLAAPPKPADVVGVVVHSDIPRTGWFECSNPLVNKLVENTLWGQKGNYLDVPTDCPQRDERAGWTGDAQVFMKTAAFNRDVSAVLHQVAGGPVPGRPAGRRGLSRRGPLDPRPRQRGLGRRRA